MIKNKSTLDIAYDYLKSEGSARTFGDIWKYIVNAAEIANPADKVAEFYTNLTLDGRFVPLSATRHEEGKEDKVEWVWDLTERRTYEERHVALPDDEAEAVFSNSDSYNYEESEDNDNDDYDENGSYEEE